jgi:uncharacterized protein GlcG (DUF336 family)
LAVPPNLAKTRITKEGEEMTRVAWLAAILAALVATPHARAQTSSSCGIPSSTVLNVQNQLAVVVAYSDHDGSLFGATPYMWSAVVDRTGRLCSVISEGDAWPGSRAIAMAKAETGNDFSNSRLAISTANLYAPTQPGGSLYGLNGSNPFNPFALPQGVGGGFVVGGIITFGGGVALYQDGKVIGGLGVSGDSSCADHAVAYRMRLAAGLNGIPGGPNAQGNDNIQYAPAGKVPTGFEQPHCFPTDLTPEQIAHPPSN